MVKKVTSLFFMLILLLSLTTGCEKKANYMDGTYTAHSEADDYGYATATVTIKSNSIVDVTLTEYSGKGLKRDMEDYLYQPTVEGIKIMRERFIEAGTSEVDIYTGSTHSSQKYIDAVAKALAKAHIEEIDRPQGRYFDGVYLGTSQPDQYSWGLAWVTIKDDRIIDVRLEEINVRDEQFVNWEDYPYQPAIEARQLIAQRIIEADTYEVETITSATRSCLLWQEAVAQALTRAATAP